MSNILSYPLIPTVSGEDLLIISDISVKGNPTRSVRVNQLVGDGSGSVTSVATSSGTFVDVSGGTITTAGTITADLSAAGTASASTYLRGDNTWASLPEGVLLGRYLALVTQTGTGVPTASVMVNTMGVAFEYYYISAGVYRVKSTPPIFYQHSVCFWITPSINNKPWTGAVSIIDPSFVELQSIEASTGVAFNDAMDQVTFEIQRFPYPV